MLIVALGAIPAFQQGRFSYYLSAGRKALAAGDFDKAHALFKKGVKLRPKNAEIQYRMAVVCRRSGKLEELRGHLKQAKDLGWNKEDIYRQQLLLKAQLGRFQEVAQEMQSLFEGDVSDEAALEVYEALAFGYWSDHQIQEAMKCLNYWIRWRKEDIDPRLMRAAIYNEFNDPASAEKEYRDILKFAPDHTATHSALAQLLLKGGRVDEAAKEFRYCIDHGLKTAEVFFGLAECEFRSSRPDEAEKYLKNVNFDELSLERRAKVLKLEADIAQFRGDHEKVVELLGTVLKTWPHDVGVHQTITQSYQALGRQELAEKHLAIGRDISARAEKFYNLQRQVISHPDDPELRYLVGDTLAVQGLFDDAAGWWQSALRIDGYHQPSHEALVRYYTDKGDADFAARHRKAAELSVPHTFRRAWGQLDVGRPILVEQLLALINQYPKYSHYSAVLTAALLNKQDKFTEALSTIEPVLQNPELRIPASIVQSEALIGLDQPLVAEQLLKDVLKEHPDNIEAHRWLAVIYYDIGAANEAEEHLLKVAKLDPNDPRPYRLLGLMNKDYEIFDRAIICYREALRRKSDMPEREEVLLELADCLIRQHDYAGAQEVLDQASPSPDRDAMTAEYLFNMGKTEEAAELIDDVLEEKPDHVRALLLRGESYLVDQENQKAAEVFKRVVDMNPFDYEVRRKYATAIQRAGDEATATQEFTRSDELKELRKRFATLHETAILKPFDASIRRELADIAQKLGRDDLAGVWTKAAEALENDASHDP